MLGGDLQVGKKALLKSGVAEKLGASVVAPARGRPTCVTGNGASQIDLYLISRCLEQAAVGNDLVEKSGLATHKPHRLYMPKAAAHVSGVSAWHMSLPGGDEDDDGGDVVEVSS